MQPVCLVIGAGAGIGSHVGSRFAREGYHAVLCRRTDEEGLNRAVAGIVADGAAASGLPDERRGARYHRRADRRR